MDLHINFQKFSHFFKILPTPARLSPKCPLAVHGTSAPRVTDCPNVLVKLNPCIDYYHNTDIHHSDHLQKHSA